MSGSGLLACARCGPVVAAYGAPCPRCGGPLVPGTARPSVALPPQPVFDPETVAARSRGSLHRSVATSLDRSSGAGLDRSSGAGLDRSSGAGLDRSTGTAPTDSSAPSPASTSITTTPSGRQRAPAPPEVDQARLDPKRAFAHFLVLNELGRGGMGVVYKAWDDSLGRLVALKLLAQEADATMRERFQREAAAVARLRHPSIVAVHNAGEAQGRGWLAMDYIEGTTLDQRIKAETLPLRRGIEIVRTVARAIQYAHEQGVIHRDLKPQNVIVGREDHPYVLDFGLATALAPEGALTRAGSTLGTPSYMPPEQVEGSSTSVTARSDVYSLGATLYHALTGEPPFSGLADINIITALLTKDPEPPSRLDRRAEGDLDTIVMKCLEKDPARRYATAEELAQELDRWLAGDPIVARPLGIVGRARRRLRRNAKTVVIVLVTLVVSFGVFFAAGAPQRAKERHAAELLQARKALSVAAAAVDGEVTAKLDQVEREPAIDAPALAPKLLQATSVVATEEALRARLIDDSTRGAGAALSSDERIALVDAYLKESARAIRGPLLARAAHIQGIAWSPPGKRVAAHWADAVREAARAYRLDPEGPHGAAASIEIGESLLERHDWKRALLALDTIVSRGLGKYPALRARALFGAGKAALAIGEYEGGRDRVRRALETGALEGDNKDEAEVVRGLMGKLLGRGPPPLPIHTPTVVPDPKGGLPYLFGFATRGDPLLLVYRYEPGRQTFNEVATLPLEATDYDGLDFVTADGALRLFTIHGRDRAAQIEVFDFDGSRLTLEKRVPIRPQVDGKLRVVRAGDVDGDGKPDLVCTAGLGKDWVTVILDPLGAQVFQELFRANNNEGCDGHYPVGADLDGSGKSDVVVASNKWNGFCIRVLEWSQPLGPPTEVARRVIGRPRPESLDRPRVRGPSGRELVYVGADRDADSEAIFDQVEGPGSTTSDAIWRVSRAPGKPVEFTPVLARDFRQHATGRLELVGPGWLGRPWAEAIVAFESTHEWGSEENQWVVAPRPGPSARTLCFRRYEGDPFSNVLFAADLDGDGEPELLTSVEDGIVVKGIAAFADKPAARPTPPPVRETSALDVGLDLLACGVYAEAAAQLESVEKDPGVSSSERARASFALARACAGLGDQERARSVCLALAEREPRLAKEALLQAEEHAEEKQLYDRALEDLTRLRLHEALTADEAREVERRRLRVEPFTRLTPGLRLDAATMGALPWIVTRPLQARLTRDGLRLHSRAMNGEAPILQLPVIYPSQSLRMRAHFRVESLPFGSAIGFGLVTNEASVMAHVDCRGGGDVNAWRRGLGVTGGGWGLDAMDPTELFDVEVVCSVEDRQMIATYHRGAGAIVSQQFLPPPTSSGARIAVLSGGWTPPFDSARVLLQDLAFEGPPGQTIQLDTRDEAPQLTEAEVAFNRFVFGDRAAAEPLLAAVAARPGPSQALAVLVDAVALAETGRGAEATAIFTRVLRDDPHGLTPLFEAMDALDDKTRQAIAAAWSAVNGRDPNACAQRAVQYLGEAREGHVGEALIAALAGKVEVVGGRILLAQIHAMLGEPERALDLLADVPESPFVLGLRGTWLCELGRYEEALKSFGDGEVGNRFEPYRQRAQRLSAGLGRGPK